MKKILLCLIILSFISSVYAEDSYLCIGEKSAGVALKNGVWEDTLYTYQKYIIKKVDDIWTLFRFGNDEPLTSKEFGKMNGSMTLSSDHTIIPYYDFRYNKNRFELHMIGSYVYEEEYPDATIGGYVEIGSCSKI